MRTVTFGMNISLDGYCDHTIFNPSEEVHEYFTTMMEQVDLLFFGRVMYQLMFPYWSDVAKNRSGSAVENRFADRISAIDSVVVSKSLKSTQNNARIVSGNPSEELMKLKQQPGKKIAVDSVSMLPELLAAGLIDEFNLVVHPGLAGHGRRLLDTSAFQDKIDLKPVDIIHFKSGAVALHYLIK